MNQTASMSVVEHNPRLSLLFHDVLTNAGDATELWPERAGAFEYIHGRQPDLVIWDLWLRRQGGG